MKNRLVLLSCGAAAVATFAFVNGDATAQPGSSPGSRDSSDLPLNQKCVVTLDALSNSRSAMTTEMQQLSGFFRPDTAQGVLIQTNSQWLVLKDGDSENWIPRDKVLMVRVQR